MTRILARSWSDIQDEGMALVLHQLVDNGRGTAVILVLYTRTPTWHSSYTSLWNLSNPYLCHILLTQRVTGYAVCISNTAPFSLWDSSLPNRNGGTTISISSTDNHHRSLPSGRKPENALRFLSLSPQNSRQYKHHSQWPVWLPFLRHPNLNLDLSSVFHLVRRSDGPGGAARRRPRWLRS